MIKKQTDTAFVGFAGFAEGQGFAHEVGTALPKGVVQTLDMGGLARFLAHRMMTFGRKKCGIGRPEIGETDRSFTIIRREGVPQAPPGFRRAIPHGKPNDAAGLSFQGQPDPNRIGFGTHKGPQLIQFEDGAFGQWPNGISDGPETFFFRILATVMRLKVVIRAMARCDTRS